MDYEAKIRARIKTAQTDLEEAKERRGKARDNFQGKELASEIHMCEAIIEATTYLIEELDYLLEQGEEGEEEG